MDKKEELKPLVIRDMLKLLQYEVFLYCFQENLPQNVKEHRCC